MKKIVTYVFAGLLGFAACETTMGMNVAAILQQRDPKNGNTALHAAVKKGHISIVKDLLLPRCTANDVNAVNNDGWAALHFAAKEGDLDMFNLLLGHPGVKINIADNKRETPLHLAIENWNNNIASVLILTPGIDVNALTTAGRSPLSLAAKKGNAEIVQLLLNDPNINPNIADGFSNSALHSAIDKANADEEDIQTALLLINDGRVDVNGELNPLSTAISRKNMTIIKALFARPDLDLSGTKGVSIVFAALDSDNSKVLEFLLSDLRYTLKTRGMVLSSIAEHYKDSWEEELVLMLLNDPNVDLNAIDIGAQDEATYPLMQFVLEYEENVKLFVLLLKNSRVDLNENYFPCMDGNMLKTTHISPCIFLLHKLEYDVLVLNYTDRMECLLKLFLLSKLAPSTIPTEDELEKRIEASFGLVKRDLWSDVINILYSEQSELAMFDLAIRKGKTFDKFKFECCLDSDFWDNISKTFTILREFAPRREELQQLLDEKYCFIKQKNRQDILDTL